MYPNDAAVVQRAMRQARTMSFAGLGTPSSVANPDSPGGQIVDDGAGNMAFTDASGNLLKFVPALTNKVAWTQNSVYIAGAIGLVLGGVGGFLYLTRRK